MSYFSQSRKLVQQREGERGLRLAISIGTTKMSRMKRQEIANAIKRRPRDALASGASELTVAAEGFQMTAHGLRKLGSGTTDSGGSKSPGGVVGLAALVAKGNPAELIVETGVKVYGEKTGSSKVEGRAKQTAEEIAEVLKKRFQEQGWIKEE